MTLREARKAGIKCCENNNSSYACISYSNDCEYTVTNKENNNTVYFINRNGSLDAYCGTNYAINYHKERERRENGRGKSLKKRVAELFNCSEIEE